MSDEARAFPRAISKSIPTTKSVRLRSSSPCCIVPPPKQRQRLGHPVTPAHRARPKPRNVARVPLRFNDPTGNRMSWCGGRRTRSALSCYARCRHYRFSHVGLSRTDASRDEAFLERQFCNARVSRPRSRRWPALTHQRGLQSLERDVFPDRPFLRIQHINHQVKAPTT